MKECENCKDLRQEYKIGLPYEFIKAIRVIKENLIDGTIIEKAVGKENTFLEIKEEGPWEDTLDYRFMCNECDREFRLVVETYHGRGGKWYETKCDD